MLVRDFAVKGTNASHGAGRYRVMTRYIDADSSAKVAGIDAILISWIYLLLDTRFWCGQNMNEPKTPDLFPEGFVKEQR